MRPIEGRVDLHAGEMRRIEGEVRLPGGSGGALRRRVAPSCQANPNPRALSHETHTPSDSTALTACRCAADHRSVLCLAAAIISSGDSECSLNLATDGMYRN